MINGRGSPALSASAYISRSPAAGPCHGVEIDVVVVLGFGEDVADVVERLGGGVVVEGLRQRRDREATVVGTAVIDPPMEDHAGRSSAAAARDADLDELGCEPRQPPPPRPGSMAERCANAAVEERGDEFAFRTEVRVTDGEHTWVLLEEPTTVGPTPDRGATDAEFEELPVGDHSPLLARRS